MRRLSRLLSQSGRPLFLQAVSAIEANNSNTSDNAGDNNDNNGGSTTGARREGLEKDLRKLQGHLLALGKTESSLTALAEKKASFLVKKDKQMEVEGDSEEPVLESGSEASELPEVQSNNLVEVLTVSQEQY